MGIDAAATSSIACAACHGPDAKGTGEIPRLAGQLPDYTVNKLVNSLDASAAYNVTNYLAVTFEAQNLTDAKVVQYDNTLSNPRAIYDNGRVYFAGVKLRF